MSAIGGSSSMPATAAPPLARLRDKDVAGNFGHKASKHSITEELLAYIDAGAVPDSPSRGVRFC